MVFVHDLTAHFQVVDIPGGHLHENWGSLNDKTDVDTHAVSGEHLEIDGVHIVLLNKLVQQLCLLERQFLRGSDGFVVVELFLESGALSFQIVEVAEDRFFLAPRLIDNLHITGLFIVNHLRLFIVEQSSLSLHTKQVDLARELKLD